MPLFSTTLTLVLGVASAPGMVRATQKTDGLFYKKNGTIVDFDGDPGSWTVLTGDHLMSIADGDDGFRISKGSTSYNRVIEATHTYKQLRSLSEFLEQDHPLCKTALTIDRIRAAYTALRATEDR